MGGLWCCHMGASWPIGLCKVSANMGVVNNQQEKAAIKKLLKLTQSKEEQALILEQSMENGWIGIFALKSEKKRKINDLMNEYNKGLEILNKQFDD